MRTLKLILILLLFSNSLYSQGLTLSIRDSNLGRLLDYEFGFEFFDNGSQKLYVEFERDNDRLYRKFELVLQKFGGGINIFEKTSRGIDNMEIFYNYKNRSRKYRWIKLGSSILRDISDETFLLGNILVQVKQFKFKYQRGKGKQIIDSSLTYSKSLREEAFAVGQLTIKPVFSLLMRWYQDKRKKYRQIKIGFTFEFGGKSA